MKSKILSLVFAAAILVPQFVIAQPDQSVEAPFYGQMKYRSIGPFRGGRSAAVTGVPSNPMLYYMGGTGGGVWRTTNGGTTWENISDGFFGGSIGAIAVSEWDPNVIYVGGGEVTVRGNVSHGYGMWKSTDAGKTWKNVGLNDSRRIPRIRIHPKNPNLVYAAVMGHLFGPNKERGVFRSTDGGESWEKILFVNDEVGAVDLAMDPSNPRILYASTWRVLRTPYSLESGGEGSGLWKSTDGGDTWNEITRNDGLPKGIVGIIGVTISPVNHNRIWTIIESKEGGVFRSDDGGESWFKINDERKLRQRAWYYTRIYADTKDQDIVYVLNVGFWRSKDGGKTYKRIRTPHGDHHDFWISPNNSSAMIVADDGGAQVSFDAGQSFSTYYNQPTAQFYRVITDNDFPYRIYGAQQDNSTVRIFHRSEGYSISEDEWEATAGGESGWIAPHPENSDIVYGGSYGGFLTRVNHETGEMRSVNVYPDDPMGHGAKDWKFRFQWNFPILISKHDPNVVYTAGNVLFKSTNEGQSWEQISGDLTRNDTTKMESSGGPITKDNTSVEYYCTIFTVAESNFDKDVIWTGSDDGLIFVTKDGGGKWKNVTPDADMMPEWTQINSIEADPFHEGGLFVAATAYKSDDFHPYLYKTSDYGESWTKITKGIDVNHFTRVIRADPQKRAMLYAGTESGMYISFDEGENWDSFQLNLPVVPITDLAIKDNDLIVATQGRSFWMLDDLTPLHQWSESVSRKSAHLFSPRAAYRLSGGRAENLKTAGINAHNGVVINYYFKDKPDSSDVQLNLSDEEGRLIKSFRPDAEKDRDKMDAEKGMNTFVWNMRYPGAERFKGMIIWGGGTSGPKAVPGKYTAQLISGGDTISTPFKILKDPRVNASTEDLAEQFDFLIIMRDKISETHKAVTKIRGIKKQVNGYLTKAKNAEGADSLKTFGKKLLKNLSAIEQALYQTKNRSPQDPLNFPIRLNNKLTTLASSVSMGDNKPTDQAYEVREELFRQVDLQLNALDDILENGVPQFNKLVFEAQLPAIVVEEE